MKQDCATCYNFGIVSTKLNALLVCIPFFVGFIGWGGYQLYDINGKIQGITALEKRIERLENNRGGEVDVGRPTVAGVEEKSTGE